MSCDDSRDAELIDRRDGDKLIAPRLVTRQASARRIHASDGGIGIDGVAGVEKGATQRAPLARRAVSR